MLRVCFFVVEHVVFSIRIPKVLADEIDKNLESTGHSNRNDFIRSACRYYLLELLQSRGEPDPGNNTKSEGMGRA